MVYFWIGVILLSLACELLSHKRVALWLAPAAAVAAVLAALAISVFVQIPLFLLLSLLLVFVIRPLVSRGGRSSAMQIDDMIGERAVVVEKIENVAGAGQVKVCGQFWSARAVDDEHVYEEGESVTVIAVEGVKLICKK